MLEWMIWKNVSPFKIPTLQFTMVSAELQILFKFTEIERNIHFVI